MEQSMHRVIGIDFGTSTTMIKAREYDDSTAGELLCKAVTFTQGGTASTPTLIRRQNDTSWYGFDAEQSSYPGSVLYNNFKMMLKSDSDEEREKAVQLIEEFFRFLFGRYHEQERFLFSTSDNSLEYKTMVSYPAQWDESQQNIMLEAAKKAGFRNVVGQDEASAAVSCILKAKQRELEAAGYLQQGKPLHILVIDMGAGTTDLAFAEVHVGETDIRTEIKEIWPPRESAHLYGGSMMDAGILQYIRNWIQSSGVKEDTAENISKGQQSHIKLWKEITVSALLQENRSVTECLAISNIFQQIGMPLEPFPPLDRAGFEEMFRSEITEFVNIINTAPAQLRDETELVFLTGGNSQWYWIEEILCGENTSFGDPGLRQIQHRADAVLRMELPAETVSRGLVYGTDIRFSRTEEAAPVQQEISPASEQPAVDLPAAAAGKPAGNMTVNSYIRKEAKEITRRYAGTMPDLFLRNMFSFDDDADGGLGGFTLTLVPPNGSYTHLVFQDRITLLSSDGIHKLFSWQHFMEAEFQKSSAQICTVKMQGTDISFVFETAVQCASFLDYMIGLRNDLCDAVPVFEAEAADTNAFDEKCWQLAIQYTYMESDGRALAEKIAEASAVKTRSDKILIKYKGIYGAENESYAGFQILRTGFSAISHAAYLRGSYSWEDFIHAQIFTKGKLIPWLYIAKQNESRGLFGDKKTLCTNSKLYAAIEAYLTGLQKYLKENIQP